MAIEKNLNVSVSGVPTEWTLKDGTVWDVKRWPARSHTEEWLKTLQQLPDIPGKKTDALKYVEKYMNELDPDAHKDYLILRSKNPIERRGGSECQTAYAFRHMFVIKKDGDKIGTPCDVDPAVHLRYSRLNNKIVLRGHNSKHLTNFFESFTAPDQSEAMLPRYSTSASSYEVFYRESMHDPMAVDDDELNSMQNFSAMDLDEEDILLLPADVSAKTTSDKKRPAEKDPKISDQPPRSKPRTAAPKKDANTAAFYKMLENLKPEDLDAKTALQNVQTMVENTNSDAWAEQKRKTNDKVTCVFKYICTCVTDPAKKENVLKLLADLRGNHLKKLNSMELMENISALLHM